MTTACRQNESEDRQPPRCSAAAGGNRRRAGVWGLLALVGFAASIPRSGEAQQGAWPVGSTVVNSTPAAENFDTPLTRMRPIEELSAVDVMRPTPASQALPAAGPVAQASTSITRVETAHPVRQAAMMQSSGPGFTMPPGGTSPGIGGSTGDSIAMPPPSLPVPLSSVPGIGPVPPPAGGPLPSATVPSASAPMVQPAPLPSTGLPGASVPSTSAPLTTGGGSWTAAPQSPSDYHSIPQPRLDSGFATMSNCRNITGPSSYRSDRILTCGPPASHVTTIGPPSTFVHPPAQIGPPAVFPPAAAGVPMGMGQTVIPGPAGHRPLISFGQERFPVQVGQGIFGQPTAYVPGQRFRNMIRYLTF